jgi:hypothetical protein
MKCYIGINFAGLRCVTLIDYPSAGPIGSIVILGDAFLTIADEMEPNNHGPLPLLLRRSRVAPFRRLTLCKLRFAHCDNTGFA